MEELHNAEFNALYSSPNILGDQTEKNQMGKAYSMEGGRVEVYTGFWCGNLRERDHLKDPGTDGRYIKIDRQEVMCGHGLDRCGSR
jgi:hypothetical protein